MNQPPSAGDRPRVEPEIIPPHSNRARQVHGTARIHVVTLGPLGATILALAIGIFTALVLVILLGAFLIWIPVVGLIAAAAIVFGILRERIGRAP